MAEPSDDDPIIAELRRIRAEQSAALGNDIHRIMAASRRRQFLQGNDLVARDKATGRFVVVFKGTGKRAEELDHGLD
jgi:hypothetical protein